MTDYKKRSVVENKRMGRPGRNDPDEPAMTMSEALRAQENLRGRELRKPPSREPIPTSRFSWDAPTAMTNAARARNYAAQQALRAAKDRDAAKGMAKGGEVKAKKQGSTANLLAKAEDYAARTIAKREGMPLGQGMARGGNVRTPPKDPTASRKAYKGRGMAEGGEVPTPAPAPTPKPDRLPGRDGLPSEVPKGKRSKYK